MEAYMKKSAVIILMVAMFSGSVFASGACKYSTKTGISADTAANSASSSQSVRTKSIR